jgi:hypothetical protein
MASGKSLEKQEPRLVKVRYRKDGQPIQRVDAKGNPVRRVRMSKKERRRLRREERDA